MYKLLKPLLFKKDAEDMHNVAIRLMSTVHRSPALLAMWKKMNGVRYDQCLHVERFGLTFDSPVGLSAGLDKHGQAVNAFAALGFGFIEVGTVTPLAQPGNDKPRLFRLPAEQALINRMGFNSVGASKVAEHLNARPARVPLFINVGKNKDTPLEQAHEDYVACLKELYRWADAFVLNISSPNTKGLRDLHNEQYLLTLLSKVQEANEQLAAEKETSVRPVLLKLSPDMTPEQLEPVLNIVGGEVTNSSVGDAVTSPLVDGLVVANTTVSRAGVTRHPLSEESGGLSGRPLLERSTELVKQVYRETGGRLPIIASGGIFTAEHAYQKICAGATLVQVYTGLIYEGPSLIRQINKRLPALLAADGFERLEDAIGTAK